MRDSAAAFPIAGAARMINQDLSHQTRGHAEEMGAVLPRRILPIDQPKVDLVDERGGLERVAHALASEITAGEARQFCGDQRRELLESVLVAVAPRAKELRHLGRRRLHGNDGVIVIVSARAANTLLTAVSRLPCRLSGDAWRAIQRLSDRQRQPSSGATNLRMLLIAWAL